MKTANRTIILAGLVAAAVILGIIVSILSRGTGAPALPFGNSQQTEVTPTPPEYVATNINTIATTYQQAVKRLPQEDQIAMKQFVTKLPHLSADVDIVHDRQLDVVLVSFKTERGPDTLQDLLSANGVWDIYISGSRSFITSTKSINELSNLLKNVDTYDPEDHVERMSAP